MNEKITNKTFNFSDGYSDMVVDGEHGSHMTSSHLMLTLTAQHHGAVITCEALNEIIGKRVHDSFTFSVRRKWKFLILIGKIHSALIKYL